MIELNGSGDKYGFTDDAIHELLLSYQFVPYQYDPFSRQLTSLEKYGPFNTIYIRDKDWIANRVVHAKKFTILGQLI